MDIDVLKNCGQTRTYSNGQILCQEGETGHSMFILLKGQVEISINSFSDNPQSLGVMPEGSFFGEMSLLESKPRSATIIACSDEVTVLEVSETDFSKLLLEAASITYRLLLTLNNRLNNMLDRIEPDDKRFVFKYKKNPYIRQSRKWMSALLIRLQKKIPITCGSF